MKGWSPAFLLIFLILVPLERFTLLIWLPVILLWLHALFLLLRPSITLSQQEHYGLKILSILIPICFIWVLNTQYWAQQRTRMLAQHIAQTCWHKGLCPQTLAEFNCNKVSCYRIYRSLGVTPYLQAYVPNDNLQKFRLILFQGGQQFIFHGGVNLVFKEYTLPR